MSTKKYTIHYLWDGTSCLPSERVDISIEEHQKRLLINIDAPFHHDPPPPVPPQSLWGLWEYEVVEVFLVGSDGQYLEAEFSPHGHHLLLWLSSPRQVTHKHLPVDFEVTHTQNRWKGRAYIDLDQIPNPVQRCNFFAIHGLDKHRRYLCYSPLNTVKPDFHQPDRFPLFEHDPESPCT